MANGTNNIPERLINFRVYNSDNQALGLVNVDLPTIEAMSDTVSGAGIAGEVESPVLGHFQSITCTFHWRTIEPEATALVQQKAHQIDLRGSQQVYDAANGEYSSVPIRFTLQVVPKSITFGTFEPGASTDTEQEFEVMYLKAFVDGKEVAEIDKYNFVCKFGDTDVFETVRQDLGMA